MGIIATLERIFWFDHQVKTDRYPNMQDLELMLLPKAYSAVVLSSANTFILIAC
jgi:hypothetical protein